MVAGKLVLAVARHNVDAKGGSAAGMTRRMTVSSGGTEDWTARSKHPPSWHWLVLLVAGNLDYVGPAVRHASAGLQGAPSSSLESLPVLTAVLMSWHPEGGSRVLVHTYRLVTFGVFCPAQGSATALTSSNVWGNRLCIEGA